MFMKNTARARGSVCWIDLPSERSVRRENEFALKYPLFPFYAAQEGFVLRRYAIGFDRFLQGFVECEIVQTVVVK